MFNFGFKRRNNGLPKQGLLLHLKAPGNSDNMTWTEAAAWDEQALWVAYVLPLSFYPIFGTGAWYSDSTTPITRTMAQILADPMTNQYHVLASATKGVAVYDPYIAWDSTIRNADRYFKAPRYDDAPTAFFNGSDITGSTSFDSGVLGTNPGQWVLDNTGKLVNAGVDVIAAEGMRLEWVANETHIIPQPLNLTSGWLPMDGATVISATSCSIATGGYVRPIAALTIGKKYRCVLSGASANGNIRLRNGATGLTLLVGPGAIDAVCDHIYKFQIGSTVSTDTLTNIAISIQELLPTWRDTDISGNPILPSTLQPTRTFDAGFATATPSTTFAKYPSTNPLVMPRYLSEPARTNKVTCRKANPVDTSGLTPGGSGTNGGVSVVTNITTIALIASAKLQGICTTGTLYKIDNSTGGANVGVTFTGLTVNTNAHSMQLAVAGTGSVMIRYTGEADVLSPVGSVLTFIRRENSAPAISKNFALIVSPGAVVYFILPQLEEGPFCTSPIAKLQDGTDPLTAITRAGTVLSFPTLGKIRSNNMAFRMIVVPRAGGQGGSYILGSTLSTGNAIQLICESTGIWLWNQKAGVDNTIMSTRAHATNTPLDIIWYYSSTVGMQVVTRAFSGVAWGSWVASAIKSDTDGKGNKMIGATFQIGSFNSLGQFTGNISELDTLFIPDGITDPLAWAKAQWGIV